MSLDVSPDGKEIAFDLLGDIYTIPFAGGEATRADPRRRLGDAAALQPRRQAHRLHQRRGGGENIWMMDARRRSTAPVTKETFRLLNGPVWTPGRPV